MNFQFPWTALRRRSLPGAASRSLLIVAVLSAVPFESARAQEGETALPLSYRLSAEGDGSSWGTWSVTQGRDIALARGVDDGEVGDVALVAGPAVDGLPAALEENQPYGGLLGVLFDPAAELGPGFQKTLPGFDDLAVLDSLRLDLRAGGANDRIAGHDTRHHVLTVRLWWRQITEEGSETAWAETGTADLWFAPELPFSWIPFAVHPANPGLAFPLWNSWPEVAGAVIGEYGSRLEGFGLLLRARTRDEARAPLSSFDHERSVSVSELATAPEPPSSESYAELPRLSKTRKAFLDVAFFLLTPCRSLETAEAGSFDLAVSGPRSSSASGPGALFLTDAGHDDAYVVVAGSGGMAEGRMACTVLVLPGVEPRTGTFPVVGPEPFRAPTEADPVVGLHVEGEGETLNRLLVLNEGEVRIDQAGPDAVRGELASEGWGLELIHPDRPRRMIEDLEVEMSFRAVRAAPASKPARP